MNGTDGIPFELKAMSAEQSAEYWTEQFMKLKGENVDLRAQVAELEAHRLSAGRVAEDLRSQLTKRVELYRARDRAIVNAAKAYIDECENPAPDLAYRRQLRDRLAAAVHGKDTT